MRTHNKLRLIRTKAEHTYGNTASLLLDPRLIRDPAPPMYTALEEEVNGNWQH